MKFVTYDIQFDLGKYGQFDLERIAGEVNGADIIMCEILSHMSSLACPVHLPGRCGAQAE